ncbi:MAG TPA: hypothetical protein VE641_17450 [Chthoniobacterales bacterium]|jgi:hypothetical protein|nr:hypothetical protein [Chthoniobacterales bacterium]
MVGPGNKFQLSPKLRAFVSGFLFLLIPVTFLVTVRQLTKAKGPQWLPFTFENPYNYLFNSLLLLKGQAPYSIDHPGTTTQVLGAIILRASSLASNDDLIKKVLQQPEHYIRILHWALLIFTVLVLWLVPWLTAGASGSRIIGLLIQAPSLFFGTLLWYGILFGPDLMLVPFSVTAVCCCTLLVILSRFEDHSFLLGIGGGSAASSSPRRVRTPAIAAVTGLVCALGIATKLTFFPLIFISMLCCRSRRNLLAFAISFIVGLAFAFLPIYSQLSRLLTWTFNLGIHSGRYDTGSIGLPPSGVYIDSLLNLVQTEPLVIVIPIVATIVLLSFSILSRSGPHPNKVARNTALVLLLIQVISVFLIAKEMGIHYLIPLSLTTGLNLVLLFQACREIDRPNFRKAIGWITLVALLAFGGVSFVEGTLDRYEGLTEDRRDLVRLYRHAEEVTRNDVRVDYFFSDSPTYPLCYGNDWAGGAFGSLLSTLYPNRLFLDVFNSQFKTFTEWITPEEIRKKYDHLYFFGRSNMFPKVNGFDSLTFETIDQADGYSLQKWTRK